MTDWFIELRRVATKGSDSIAADIMRHMHTRQHLGNTAVVCDQPVAMLSAARKQWLKLSRSLQKQRSGTLNADKILKYTHTITRMQHMGFSAKTPLENPEASVYFLRPDQLEVMPVYCWTTYLTAALPLKTARQLLIQLPPESLVVDYLQSDYWQEELQLKSKKALELRVDQAWVEVQRFLREYRINTAVLAEGGPHDVEAMDAALDTLLGVTQQFLRVADDFRRALELARPIRLTKDRREAFDSLILLAHRVQALSPGAFNRQFLETYNEDDTFFLYDRAKLHAHLLGGETLLEAYGRHRRAGRFNLAQALYLKTEG